MRIRDTIKRGWTMAEQATSKHMRNKIVKEVFAQQAYEELLKQKTFSEHNKDKVAKFIEVEQKELLLGKKEALQDKDTKKKGK
jgi:ribosomal protein S17E